VTAAQRLKAAIGDLLDAADRRATTFKELVDELGDVRLARAARGQRWVTKGPTLDYQWAREDIQTWAAVRQVQLLEDILRELRGTKE